jgi:hypothetical protein
MRPLDYDLPQWVYMFALAACVLAMSAIDTPNF